MEEEALKLKELQSEVDKQIGVSSPQHLLDRSNSNTSINLSYEEKVHADFRNKLKYLNFAWWWIGMHLLYVIFKFKGWSRCPILLRW